MTRKRNATRRSRIGIKWKLFACFTGFTAFVLLLLWLFQIVWLDDIYESITLSTLKKSAATISDNVENENIQTLVDQLARDSGMCVLVYRADGQKVASADMDTDCLIHRATSDSLNMLYAHARQNGGSAVETLIRDRTSNIYYSENDFVGDVPKSGAEKIKTIVYTLIDGRTGEDVIIMINAAITPVSATTKTLTVQLGWITAILLVAAMGTAVLLSRLISAPIVAMNQSAKELAAGNYHVSFSGNGYRETAELSDTLNYAAHELSMLDRMQKELIANISHDLRTPLTMIAGYSEVMRDIPGENTPENMQIVIDETNRLSSLVSDMLDISKLQDAEMRLTLSVFSLTEILRTTLARYRHLREREGYTFDLICTENVWVEADKTRILQVLYNLMNNAINYTGADKTVHIRQICCGEVVRVEIEDTGEGIEAEQLPHIWERYYRVDRVHRRAMVGTGLGLSIVKNILILHGARFGVSSEIGQGSTFWFELNIHHTGEAEIADTP